MKKLLIKIGAIAGGAVAGYGGLSAFTNMWRFSPNTCVGPSPMDINQMGFYILLASFGLGLALVSICLMEWQTMEEDKRNEMWNRIYLME